MNIGRMVGVLILAVLGGLISGLITRSLVIGIFFPIFMIVLFLMYRALGGINREQSNTQEEVSSQQKSEEENKNPDSTGTQQGV